MNTISKRGRSPNFWFLEEHDPFLVTVAATAERYVFEDPVASLVRLRTLAELLAKRAAAQHGIHTDRGFQVLLSTLREQRILPKTVFEFFDLLRFRGNIAVHNAIGDRQTALRALISAREISLWFHRTFKDPGFSDGAFRPPSNPKDIEEGLRKELEDLREEAAVYRKESEEAHGRVRSLEEIHSQLQDENDSAFELLAAADERAEELEQRQRLFEERLASLAETANAHPTKDVESYIRRGKQAALKIGLRGDEAEYPPFARLRILAGDRYECCGFPMFLAQVSDGGFVKAVCWNRNRGCEKDRTFSRDDFFNLDLWVSCPNCGIPTEADIVGSNYGYKCLECGWQCHLASLLPCVT